METEITDAGLKECSIRGKRKERRRRKASWLDWFNKPATKAVSSQ